MGGITFDEAPEPKKARILTGGQVVESWLFHFGAAYKTEKGVIDFGYIYTYGREKDGFISGATYSMDLHEIFIGYTRKV